MFLGEEPIKILRLGEFHLIKNNFDYTNVLFFFLFSNSNKFYDICVQLNIPQYVQIHTHLVYDKLQIFYNESFEKKTRVCKGAPCKKQVEMK